ncbi:MAG: aminotransferase class IV [Desulfomonilia bacterium]
MKKPIVAWLDGRFVDWRQADVSVLSHSFSRASAIFEVMSITNTASGPAMLCLDEHVDRFFSSAERTYMTLPFSPQTLKDAIIKTARENSTRNGVAKFYAYYTDLELGNHAPSHTSVVVFCMDYSDIGLEQEEHLKPVSVGISQFRKLHPQTAAVHAKVVGNYVNGFLARTEVRRKGFDEALMLDTSGFVAEGPTSNIFLVKGDCVETPTKENVLPGITRMLIMEVLSDMGYPVMEAHILPQDLCEYDEAFFSGTLKSVQPIKAIEGHEMHCPGEVTEALTRKIQEVYTGTIARYERYLTYIT